MTPELKARDLAVVAAYRDQGSFTDVGVQFGLTPERIRQIIVRHERATGERLPRTGRIIGGDKRRKPRVAVQCPNCGWVRHLIPSHAKALSGELCGPCGSKLSARKHLTDELIDDTIRRVLAGEKFHHLALSAGYAPRGTQALSSAVYSHLLRSSDSDTIARLWPRGVPHWLRQRCGDPPAASQEKAA